MLMPEQVTICEESSQQLNGTADIPSIILYEENFESTFKFNVQMKEIIPEVTIMKLGIGVRGCMIMDQATLV